MPQFAPGEAKTAIAPIVAKPSGMNCEAELFLGPDELTKVVSSGRVPFVSTGAAKDVSLPITMPGAPGTYHGYIDVFAEGLRFLAYILKEDVTIAKPVVEIRITSPKYNPINWYAQLFSVATKQFVPAVSGGGLHSLDTPTVFDIPPGQYLLYVHEFTMTGGWWLGPYLANIPATGVYTWNSVAETLNGVKLTSLASLPAGSVAGVLQQRSYEGSGALIGTAGWIAQLLIQEATPGTAAIYFVGTSIYIRDADLPYYGEHVSIIPVGSVITGTLDMYWRDAAFGTIWRLKNVTCPGFDYYVVAGTTTRGWDPEDGSGFVAIGYYSKYGKGGIPILITAWVGGVQRSIIPYSGGGYYLGGYGTQSVQATLPTTESYWLTIIFSVREVSFRVSLWTGTYWKQVATL